ncbi:Complex 1 LYR protein [Penicillium italicum]|uniref:Complex 1 LYR protein n=1 Tax=Penicillium italicum TaxID=40296 RepID=A0A0A2KWJ3_PENIT|nr:Complex 1 LYR protein [Penicillium italicum]
MSVASLHRETAFQARSLFSNYNFREYARRKTRDSFREHQNTTEERRIQELIQEGLQSLRLLKRQTIISQFYQLDKLVVEGQKAGKETGNNGGIVRQKDTGASRSGRHLDGAPNRTRTGQIDHDVFEGLPVRRWSRQQHTFSQAPKPDDSEFGVQGPGGGPTLPELPMPRDSQLLPPISRALLRAARAGCIHIRQGSRPADDEEKSVADADDAASASHVADRSFTTRKWMTLPKHLEPAEVEFLAKRRPGLSSLYGATAGTDGSASGPMRRTKFKKVDPETGNISIYEAWVPEGHRIEGEITGDLQTIAEQSQVPVKPEAPAPGTVVEGVGIVNAEGVVVAEAGSAAVMTPPKRRPPPPKRKGRGIGKGRKKKVMFAPGEGADAATVHGIGSATGNGEGGVKREGQHDSSHMSIDQAGQDEDDEDGDEGDESDDGDDSMMDAKTPDTPQPLSGTEFADQPSVETPAEQSVDVEMSDAVPENQPPASEISPSTEKDKQHQPEKISEVDFGALASNVALEKAEVTDSNEKPVISEYSPAGTAITPSEHTGLSAAVGEAQSSHTKVQEEEEAIQLSADLAPKEEPALPTQQDNATTLPPASPEKSLETPVVREDSEPEQTAASTDVLAETREPQQITSESISHPGTQEQPSTATEREQPTPSDASVPGLHSEEAKDIEMGNGPVPEQSQGTDAQCSANPDLPQAPPPAENTQSQPTPAESTTAAAAEPSLLEKPTPTADERTEAATETSVPDQSIVTESELQEDSRSTEAKQANDEPEKLPDTTPQAGPSEST